MERMEMEQLTGHTDNISEKIRILFRAGVKRAEIRDFLGRSYQQVQNVLKRSGLLVREPASADERQPMAGSAFELVTLAGNCRVTLPKQFVEQERLADGDSLVCSIEDGCLRLMTRDRATREILASARHHMPAQAELLGALLGREERLPGG